MASVKMSHILVENSEIELENKKWELKELVQEKAMGVLRSYRLGLHVNRERGLKEIEQLRSETNKVEMAFLLETEKAHSAADQDLALLDQDLGVLDVYKDVDQMTLEEIETGLEAVKKNRQGSDCTYPYPRIQLPTLGTLPAGGVGAEALGATPTRGMRAEAAEFCRPEARIKHASELNCQVTFIARIIIDWAAIVGTTSVGKDMIIACCESTNSMSGLIRSFGRKKKSEQILLQQDPSGIATLLYGGKSVVAIAYKDFIEFRDSDDLQVVINTHNTPNQEPRLLSVSAPSTLIFTDKKDQRVVHLLDFGGDLPEPFLGERQIDISSDEGFYSICGKQYGGKKLLACAGGINVCVYDENTNELVWKIGDKLEGGETKMGSVEVTTDGHGHLYVADAKNQSIQMFHVANGRYMGALDIKDNPSEEFFKYEDEQDKTLSAELYKLQWCEARSALFIIRKNEDACSIHSIAFY